jgi:molecular chaperone GrpE
MSSILSAIKFNFLYTMNRKKKNTEGMKKEDPESLVKDQLRTETGDDQCVEDPQPEGNTENGEKREELTPEQLLEAQIKKTEELNDRFLRLYAEFDNYRKRTIKERVELIQSASSDVISALLPVLDDFDRAIKAFEQSSEIDALKEGIMLVNSKFRTMLSQKGLEEMKSTGETFNTDLHEAVANIAAPTEEQKGKIIDEVEKGYYLNGKVLRYAKVVVGN